MKKPTSRNIYLIGMPGSGKSTLARRLARLLHFGYIDLDSSIEQHTGLSIHELFTMHGEPAFRKTEQAVLYATTKYSNTVIATGGGCAAYESNMTWMNAQGLTVYLEAPVSLLSKRLRQSDTQARPLLANHQSEIDLIQFLSETLASRHHAYSQADIVVNVPVKSLKTLVNTVILGCL